MADKLLTFNLPAGEYDADFIRILAMAVHLKLTTPNELTYWFDSGKMNDFIKLTLFARIKANRNKK